MTAKQYRDYYAQQQGYDNWMDLHRYSREPYRHMDVVMKQYALSVLPKQRSDLPKPSPLREIAETMNVGWNDCIDQIKNNIG